MDGLLTMNDNTTALADRDITHQRIGDFMPPLLQAAFAIVLVNLPFGYWRAGTRKFSAAWFVAVHAPVVLAVGVRLLLDVGLAWRALPVLILSFALGQWFGGRIRASRMAC